jgi:hypothetical protein
MRKRILLVGLILVLVLATSAQAATLIDFTDTSLMTASDAFLSDKVVWYGSWTQTTTSTGTAISAIVRMLDSSPGHAWLTNQVGPGTTVANVLASADFIAPTINNVGDLSTAPYTTLFTGLSLAAGNYFLVLRGPDSIFVNSYEWLGDFTGVGANTAPGFTVGPYGFSGGFSGPPPAAFMPASTFTPGDAGTYFFYRVESVATPLPGSVLLLGSGLLSLVGIRRRRRS